jgi:hypothetical protein
MHQPNQVNKIEGPAGPAIHTQRTGPVANGQNSAPPTPSDRSRLQSSLTTNITPALTPAPTPTPTLIPTLIPVTSTSTIPTSPTTSVSRIRTSLHRTSQQHRSLAIAPSTNPFLPLSGSHTENDSPPVPQPPTAATTTTPLLRNRTVSFSRTKSFHTYTYSRTSRVPVPGRTALPKKSCIRVGITQPTSLAGLSATESTDHSRSAVNAISLLTDDSSPGRGCQLWKSSTPPVAAPLSLEACRRWGTFHSLLPQGTPRLLPPAVEPQPYDAFTISQAAVGPHGGLLFRIHGTVHGHPVSCLIDCGATNDFISLDFVRRHNLEKQLSTTDRRVRGYDGQITPAVGMLQASLSIHCPMHADGALDTDSRQLLVTQLHSDDVILGLPWLTSSNTVIDFATRSVAVGDNGGAGPRVWYELPLAESPSSSSASELIQTITAMYGDGSDPAGDGSLSELLRTWDDFTDRITTLLHTDDRGGMRPVQSKQSKSNPELDALRRKILAEFSDTFPPKLPSGLPPSRGHELRIELRPDSRPPHRQPVRINQKHSAFETKWIKEMRGMELIRTSQSQYAAPHFYVDKPETPTTGDYRAVTDFRLLNEQTIKNRYPLPRADQLFDKLAHAKYFSKIDLRTGFYQILIREEDRHKTAFTTSQGLFEYNVLPMGLCNSPGVFMALMNDTFREYLDKFVLVFLDDIIVYSDSLEDHERHLRLALQQLRKQRLYAKLSKSALCMTEVEFLGHYVGQRGLRVMEDKIAAVNEWPVPTTIRELRAFLGLAGYYRRFVKGFSSLALSLTALTRDTGRQKLQWDTQHQLAFTELKRALQSTPVLALPDPKLPFVVHCDASAYAVGAVLQQDRGSGLQPIAYLSKKLSGAETRYPVHEQELLAIITALTTWRHYLSGTDVPVRIRTDHRSLTHFQTQPMLSGRQARWLETLSNFNYVIEYVAGPDNNVADALSRRADLHAGDAPENRPPTFVDTKKTFELNRIWVEQSRSLLEELQAADATQRRAHRRPSVNPSPEEQAAAREAQRGVIVLTEMSTATFSSELADEFERACKSDTQYSDRVRLDQPEEKDELIQRDGRLFTRMGGQLYVPGDRALRTHLIRECHDAATGGHLGRDKTLEQMKRRFFWHGMAKQVEEYVTTCDACQRNKPSQQRTPGLLMSIPSPTVAGHTWTMDLITQLPRTRGGNDAIVVWTCKFSKLCHYAACKTSIDAPTLARLFLNVVVRQHGMPANIISDRDPRFTAHFWRAFWRSMGTTLRMGTAYHPQTDGQTENSNKTLEIMLRSVIDFDQKDWDEHLAAAELAVNNSKNATTGFSPFYLFYGQEARLPLDLALAPLTGARDNPAAAEATARWRRAQQQALDNIEQAQRRQAVYANQRRRPLHFRIGDYVWLSSKNLKLVGEAKRARKLTEPWIGPYMVKRVVNANAYELDLPASLQIHPVVNVSRLLPHRDGSEAFPDRPIPLTRPDPAGTDDNGEPVWEVERVLDHRTRRNRTQYLVLWKGYPQNEATWERIEALDGALDLVIEYNRGRNVSLNVITMIAPLIPGKSTKGRSTGLQLRGRS